MDKGPTALDLYREIWAMRRRMAWYQETMSRMGDHLRTLENRLTAMGPAAVESAKQEHERILKNVEV